MNGSPDQVNMSEATHQLLSMTRTTAPVGTSRNDSELESVREPLPLPLDLVLWPDTEVRTFLNIP